MSNKAEQAAWDWAIENKLDPYSMGRAYGEGYEQAEKDLGWTSVVDALPEYEGWYIVCNDENGKPVNISISYWDTTLEKWLDVDGDDDSPGYWMPIPKLPKK